MLLSRIYFVSLHPKKSIIQDERKSNKIKVVLAEKAFLKRNLSYNLIIYVKIKKFR